MTSPLRLTVNQGEDYTLTVQWLAAGLPVDLTGVTARLQFKDKPGGTVLATFTSPSGGLVITALTGTVKLTIPFATSAAWSFTHAVYDLLLTLTDGTKKRLVQGDVYVSPQVTV